jgi:Resolvase, N terminal domain
MAPHVFPELQALAERLLRRPPVTLPASKRLTVHGYLRTDERRADYANSCADLLAWWSKTEGWRLGTIFRDLGISSDTLVRPGFGGLLDVLRMPDSAAVLVIDSTHLSASASVAKRLTLAVRRTGTQVRILADELREVGR